MEKFKQNIKKYYKYAIRSAKAELKSEVSDSRLNWLWWILEPLCFMLIYTFVFGYIFKNNQPYFAVFVFTGLTMWNFFDKMLSGSVKIITSNRDLVTKVYIPKYILLLAKSFTYLFKLVISLALVFILMIFQGVPFTWHIILIVPIILVLYLLSFGISLFLMHFGVTLTDLYNLTNLVLKMVFYLSGVFYNIRNHVSDKLAFFLLKINPIAFIMEQSRMVLINGEMFDVGGLFLWLVVGILLCIWGIRIIHKNENSYAKVI